MAKPAQIERRDILGPARYVPMRDEFRKRIIALKKHRRVEVGDRVSLVFENRDTLVFQIEEMLRAEGITSEEGIAQEIAVYNPMMPTPDELSATLFLEVPRDADAKAALHRFIGLDEHVSLLIGPHVAPARFEEGRQELDRISAVQYTRFPLSAESRTALRTAGTRVAVAIDHPNYQQRTDLTEEMRASLAKDVA